MEVLRAKHLEARAPTAASLDSYPDQPPELVPVDIIDDTVTAVAGRLSGGARLGGTDSVSLHHWLPCFGAASGELRLIVGDFTEWLGNGRPPLAAYWALMSGRLIALDKQPGIIPVVVGETWLRMMVKCLLRVTGQEATAACGTAQLSGGVEAGIEGGIHAMRVLWEEHSQEEYWGVFLINAQNAFNEENRTAMLWSVWYEWPSGAQFTFNCYRHWATLVVRDTGEGSGHFLHSKEGMTQGYPLAMISYGIGVLPLIKELHRAHPLLTQPWYADDSGDGGNFAHILAHLWYLQARGPPRGYLPELTKIILFVDPQNVARAEEFFCGMGIGVVTGNRYLGGDIGESYCT